MFSSSAKYKDACESGKIIYASFYRTLLMLNKVQIKEINIRNFMDNNSISKFVFYSWNDITLLFSQLCEKFNCIPKYIVDERPNKFKHLTRNKIIVPDSIKDDKDFDMIIVMSNYNFNEIAMRLHSIGIEYSKIISIEEFLATILFQRGS